MTVLTAIPYYGVSEELINKAVRCALAQTYPNHVVLVVGDGQVPPVTVKASNLVVTSFARNRGTPFTQQAMILGSPFEWYAPHGADDYTEPDYLAALMLGRGPARGSLKIRYHPPEQMTSFISKSRNWAEFGIFRTRTLIELGGYAAQEPCGQDSLLLGILSQTVGIDYMDQPLYHKVGRRDSLTMAPETGFGSPLRAGVKERNAVVMRALAKIGWEHHGRIRVFREKLVPPMLRAELYDRAGEIDKLLAAPRERPRPVAATAWDDGPPPLQRRQRWVHPEART